MKKDNTNVGKKISVTSVHKGSDPMELKEAFIKAWSNYINAQEKKKAS